MRDGSHARVAWPAETDPEDAGIEPCPPGAAASELGVAGRPSRLERALLRSALLAWGAMVLLAAWLLPYYQHDELAFSEWSRLIASEGGFFFPSTTLLTYQRPLVYVGQGLLWLVAGHSEPLGRLFQASFLVLLVWATFRATELLASRRQATLAALTALGMVPLVRIGTLALTDVPVAALSGAAGVLALRGGGGRLRWIGLLAISAGTILSKQSGATAIAGVLLAALVVRRGARRRVLLDTALPMLGGVAIALAYHRWLAAHLELATPTSALASGSFDLAYYLALADGERLRRAFSMAWLGDPLVGPLAFAIGSLLVGGAVQTRSHGRLGPALVGGLMAIVGTACAASFARSRSQLLLACAPGIAAAVWLALGLRGSRVDGVERRAQLALAAWAAPSLIAWIALTPYAFRLLSPAWVPLLALTAGAVGADARGFERRGRPWLAAAGAIALWIAALDGAWELGVVSPRIWPSLVAAAARSGIAASASERREILYPSFARILPAVERELGDAGVVVSPNGGFRYFFPGRALQSYPTGCSDLATASVFVLPGYPAVEDYFRDQVGVPGEPGYWAGCASPRLELIARDGVYSAFRVLP